MITGLSLPASCDNWDTATGSPYFGATAMGLGMHPSNPTRRKLADGDGATAVLKLRLWQNWPTATETRRQSRSSPSEIESTVSHRYRNADSKRRSARNGRKCASGTRSFRQVFESVNIR